MSDRQSQAFRDAEPQQWEESSLLEHPDGTLDDLEPEPEKTVEDYEAEGWDDGRAGPKTLAEARENLAARIADPGAPDTEHEAGAYDGLDETDDGASDTFADEDEDGVR